MLESICQVCHSRPASSHLLEIKPSGECLELHVCANCVAELKLDLHSNPPAIDTVLEEYEPSTSFHLAAGETPDGEGAHAAAVSGNPTCAGCGLTWSEFRRFNRFGCAGDYAAFAEQLDTLLEELHGATRHCGRVPATCATNDERQLLARKREYERQLQEAIAREDFERAATLRDRIRDLLGGSGG